MCFMLWRILRGGGRGEATYDPLESAKTFGPTLGDLKATLFMQTQWFLKDTLTVRPGDAPEPSVSSQGCANVTVVHSNTFLAQTMMQAEHLILSGHASTDEMMCICQTLMRST